MWFSPLKEALDAFIAETQRHVSGDVRLRFEAPGLLRIVGRRSPEALYDYGLATYDAADTFRHADSEGYVQDLRIGCEDVGRAPGRQERHASVMTLWSGRFSIGDGRTTLGPLGELLLRSRALRPRHPRIEGSRARVGCTPDW